jgi:hypothetical protein
MLSTCNYSSSGELFQTPKGVSFQCDTTNRIILRFDNSELSLRIQQFQYLRRSLNKIDIRVRLFDLSDESDHLQLEAPMVNLQRTFTLCEIIQLRELVNGTYFALELNSMLHELLEPASGLIYKPSN